MAAVSINVFLKKKIAIFKFSIVFVWNKYCKICIAYSNNMISKGKKFFAWIMEPLSVQLIFENSSIRSNYGKIKYLACQAKIVTSS
jgi:hypothetical protein